MPATCSLTAASPTAAAHDSETPVSGESFMVVGVAWPHDRLL